MTRCDFKAIAVLNPGTARGPLLKLSEPLSFWGGFDPTNGRILDRNHPQAGQQIAGTILALPGSRGSAGTPAGLAEAMRTGVGPVAVLLPAPDVNITIGAQVADHLYGTSTPVWLIAQADFDKLSSGAQLHLASGEAKPV